MLIDCIPIKQTSGMWKCEICGIAFDYKFTKNCNPLTPEGEKKAEVYRLKREAITKIRKARIKFPCLHKGKSLRMDECPTCCGKTNFFVFSCTLHNECVIDAPSSIDKLVHCVDCNDYLKG